MSFAFKEDRNQVNTVQVLETDFNSFYDNFYTLSALRVSIPYLRHYDLHNRFAFLFPFFWTSNKFTIQNKGNNIRCPEDKL